MRIYRQPRKIIEQTELYTTGQVVGSISISQKDMDKADNILYQYIINKLKK